MKNIVAAIILSASAFSAPAFATAITSGTPIQPGNAGCELLAEAVTINLSSNVYGAYNCDKSNNTIRVGTCHKGGSRKQATINCAVVNTSMVDGKEVIVMNDDTCPKEDYAKATFVSSSAGKAFLASTSGGSVAAGSLATPCDSAAPVDTLVTK